MLQYIVKRLLGLIPTLLLVGALAFLFVHLLPGDPARLAAGPDATPETVALVRQDLGLDKPLPQQFLRFASGVVHGDFGRSLRTKRPVSVEIGERFMPTFWLTVAAMSWSVLLGMTIGVVSAVWRNRWPDRLGMALAVSGISFPAFALGMVLMQMFAVQLNWLPTVGADSWRHYILPSLTLGAAVAAIMARFTRSSFVDILQEDYVRTARAKGLTEATVVVKHGLRNALIPVVTMMGLQFGFLLGGSIVVEVVFNWPGMGRLLVDAVDMRDYPVIQAEILLFSFEFILINLIVDVLYAVINPTIRLPMTTVEAVVVENPAVRTPWTEFWRKFKKQRVAVAAGIFVLFLVVVAILAPWLVPYDAENYFDYDSLNALPSTAALVRCRSSRTRHLQPYRDGRADLAYRGLRLGRGRCRHWHGAGPRCRVLRRVAGSHHHARL